MPDPITDLNAATAALTALHDRAATFWDDADAQIAQRRAAYDALAADLRGLFWARYFVDQVAGDDTNPGTRDAPLKSLAAAGAVLPNGTTTRIVLLSDYHVATTEFFDRGVYQIVSDDPAVPATISFAPEIDPVKTAAPGFRSGEPMVEFLFQDIIMHLSPVSPHIQWPWTITTKGSTAVYFTDCQITVAASNDRRLLENNGGIILTVKSTTFPPEMAGNWIVGVPAGTAANTVPRVLTTLNTL